MLRVLVLLLAASLRVLGISVVVFTSNLLILRNLGRDFSVDFTVNDYFAAWSLYWVATGLPQYESFYCNPTIGAPTCTGMKIRLAVFHAHVIFNRQTGINDQKKHGLKKFKNWNRSSGTRPLHKSHPMRCKVVRISYWSIYRPEGTTRRSTRH